ncbi:MAG TPA: hypothetical protein VIV60_11485 [Polyangiaceae bacterium]
MADEEKAIAPRSESSKLDEACNRSSIDMTVDVASVQRVEQYDGIDALPKGLLEDLLHRTVAGAPSGKANMSRVRARIATVTANCGFDAL